MPSVKQILSQIGIRLTSENSSGFGQFCPTYRQSKNLSGASICLKTGWVTDWAEDKRFPIDVLVKLMTGEELGKVDLDKFQPVVDEDVSEPDTWSKDALLNYLPNHEYWLKRGISKETLDFFQGGVSHGGKLYQRYVWPTFDRHGRIIGFIGRDITGEAKAKYKYEGKKNKFLFGLYNVNYNTQNRPVLSSILHTNEVILVEGPSDSVACFDEGVLNVLPTGGLNISSTMMSFLLGVNPNKITIAYNRDENFRGQDAAVKNFAKLAEHFDVDKLEIKYPIGNDLADNKKEINKWLTMPADNALIEFRNKFKRIEENKRKNLKGSNKTFTKQEMKIGRELAK